MTVYEKDFNLSALPRGFCTPECDLGKMIYLRPLARFRQGRFDYPLYELSLRIKGEVQRFKASQSDLMVWAENEGEDVIVQVGKLLEHCEIPRPSFAGLKVEKRPLIMGIVNVTPDSFSDGGDNYNPEVAIAHAKEMVAAGVDILDIGGESTRPGAAAVAREDELKRVIPVIKGIKDLGVKISIDTRHSAVMRAAINAGADIINDVTALEGEGSLEVAAELDVPVMLMHMQGEPQTMQENPIYEDCVLDIYDYLHERVRACENAGLKRENICVDPGIGFGKTLDHNMEIMNQLALYHGLGCSVLLGASRKSFIAKICGDVAAKDRLPGSLVAALQAAQAGVQLVRVHDVAQTKQALDVWECI
ncbi:Dihydropteroate synthase [Candidatus Terasakiella magnetica]|uniref:Dihydropteroate synthase n=1 Tax=Candidatus Terasakiella magnetica TaxID=1867952 RepID=A0A1C3RHQ9_9PROT|nr:dihydropteroate synthase [Candidatus Terasakiella magnetica]SCA56807.1 Dihydropteroate synthase [Candidatus Terasakiella magnetica]